MPRNRKTLSGAKPLATPAVKGQQYGSGVAQTALAQAMPTPRQAPILPSAAPAAKRPTAPPAPMPQPSQPTPDLNAIAGGLRGQVDLFGPDTSRPNEPVTHGLRAGPGGGPEVLTGMAQSPLGDTLMKLAMLTGDPTFQRLAQDNGL